MTELTGDLARIIEDTGQQISDNFTPLIEQIISGVVEKTGEAAKYYDKVIEEASEEEVFPGATMSEALVNAYNRGGTWFGWTSFGLGKWREVLKGGTDTINGMPGDPQLAGLELHEAMMDRIGGIFADIVVAKTNSDSEKYAKPTGNHGLTPAMLMGVYSLRTLSYMGRYFTEYSDPDVKTRFEFSAVTAFWNAVTTKYRELDDSLPKDVLGQVLTGFAYVSPKLYSDFYKQTQEMGLIEKPEEDSV